jgi:hypothetical protein
MHKADVRIGDEMEQNENDKQEEMLSELRLIRKAVRGILFILVCALILAPLMFFFPAIGIGAIILVGLVICAALIGAGSAKVVNKLKER